jgi:hypothetical protein
MREPYKAPCDWCGKIVGFKNIQRFNHKHHFCHRPAPCFALWRKGKPCPAAKPAMYITLTCSECGEKFQKPKSRLHQKRNKKGLRFCSRKCCGKWNFKNNSSKIKKLCKQCGNEFSVTAGHKLFCGIQCSSNWNKEHLSGNKNGKSRRKKLHRKTEIIRKITQGITRDAALSKSGRKRKYLECTPQFFRGYIEALFRPGMTWGNRNKWDIHHRTELALFNLERNPDLMFKAAHYSNCIPEWKETHHLIHNFKLVG